MRSLLRSVLVVGFSVILLVSLAYAQNSSQADDGGSASVSVNTTVPITATMDIVVNGKIVQVNLPANININSMISIPNTSLTKAQPLGNKVGSFTWNIIKFKDLGNEVKLQNHDPLKSTFGNFVAIAVDVTNLDTEDVDMQGFEQPELKGVDAKGNLYKPTKVDGYITDCSVINPGVTNNCVYVFEVPTNTKIVGLDIVAKDHGKVVTK